MYEREPMPGYGGLVSFFRAPAVTVDRITEGMAVIAGVPIDNGIPFDRPGARYGPRAIREASLSAPVLYEVSPERTLFDAATGVGLRLAGVQWPCEPACPSSLR